MLKTVDFFLAFLKVSDKNSLSLFFSLVTPDDVVLIINCSILVCGNLKFENYEFLEVFPT